MPQPPIRFVKAADGTQLAYATYGSGPPLVWAAHWLTHLELDWESPVWKHMVEFLTRHHTVIRYDERGCGLSDWTDRGFDLDTWVGDLGAIVDALGLDRFELLGISQGGPIAIEYAVRHPGRVRSLILVGTFSSGTFIPEKQKDAVGALIEAGWGSSNPAFRQLFTSLFVPDATEEQRDWFNELQARSTQPDIAAKLFRAFWHLDVRERLSQVTQPTLVLHSRGDAAIPFSAGRAVATGVPHARLVPLEGDNHLPLETSPGWPVLCREMSEFLGIRDAAPAGAGTTAATNGAYRFARCVLDPRSRELCRDGQLVPIEHRAFDLLLYLLEHRDHAVSKDELQDAVWPRMILTESALTRCVMKARRAVGDDPQRQQIIKTVHGHGYRFVAPVASPAAVPSAALDSPS
ncbi:MAG: alpha/beta fold hydrolase [Gammaproteobacteria bacterium]|nr:alpha/beta fold hydrolase [Gammaproteobacteria bacterium]